MSKTKKYSRKREAILEAIQSTRSHPSADWVYEQLRRQFPDISLRTVYRNIAAFKDEGLLVTVGVVDGEERYDADAKPHAHFVCQSCGRILDLSEADAGPELDKAAARELDARILRHQLIFYGICKDCR
ncbi:MAG: transcriptional repressor [Oscillospiraceae bacterium]|nr:transcriptional repressor [Oscillospiraceae bacterium]